MRSTATAAADNQQSTRYDEDEDGGPSLFRTPVLISSVWSLLAGGKVGRIGAIAVSAARGIGAAAGFNAKAFYFLI